MDPKDLEALGHFSPLFQWIGGLIVLLGGALTMWKAWREMMRRPAPEAPPMSAAAARADDRDFAQMERQILRNDLESVVRASRDSLFAAIDSLKTSMTENAQKDRHEFRGLIHGVIKQFEEETKELEKRIRYLEINRGPR